MERLQDRCLPGALLCRDCILKVMTKYCSHCRKDLPLDKDNFNKKRIKKDGSIVWQPWCRDCNRKRSRQYYAANLIKHRKAIRERNTRVNAEIQEKIVDYLQCHPCVDCGEDDIVVLDFDHRNPSDKETDIARAMRCSWSWKRISAEITKCDIRCANCHRKRTAREGNYYRVRIRSRRLKETRETADEVSNTSWGI